MKIESIRYSEAFKRQVVRELEDGKFTSVNQARKTYGITGMKTIHDWVHKYGAEYIQPKVVLIQTMKERDERKQLKQRIRQLEAALADAHLDHVLEKAYFHVACERMGEDPETFKKKNAMTLSEQRRRSSNRELR